MENSGTPPLTGGGSILDTPPSSKDSGPHEFIRNLLIVSKMKVDLTMLEYPKWL